jgi:nucleotide-binding universal stress UspA family protein
MAALAEGAGKEMPGIVVSVDGSADSQHALAWAATQAALEHAPLTVLAVHRVAASEWTGNPIIYPADRADAKRALNAAEKTVSETIHELGDHRPSSVTVRGSIGQVGDALIEASHDADMVVVGTRGRGRGFGRLMRGSVRAQVVNHAACPVVVIADQR